MSESQTATPYTALLDSAKSPQELYQALVNAPFADPVKAAQLFLGIVVLLLANKKTGNIDRIALSNTLPAKGTVQMSVKRFEDIKIPLDYRENIIAEAIHSGIPQQTTDWRNMFEPALTAEEARLNQAGGGIAFSAVYPLTGFGDGGAMIFSYFQYVENIDERQRSFMREYSQLASQYLAKLQ